MDRPSPLQRFAEPALAAPSIWRLLLALGFVLGGLFLLGLFIAAVSLMAGADVSGRFTGFDTAASALWLLASFLIWRPAIWLAMRLFMKRPYRSLFGPSGRLDGRAFLGGLACAAVIALVSTAAALMLVGAPLTSGASPVLWLAFAAVALPLIYIQSSAEELLFRGLMLQHMAARFSAFWAWGLIPSALFGLLHWNPASYGAAAWMVLAITGLTGLVFALVTAASGNLGAAMGLHFGLNVYALLFIAPNRAFGGLALAHWPDQDAALAQLLAIDLSVVAIVCVAVLALYRRSLRRG